MVIILGVGVAAFVIYAAFSIASLLAMRRTSEALYEFVKHSEGNLNATLTELKSTLENTRKITENVGVITEDARQIADALVGLEKGVKSLYGRLTDELTAAAEANIAGLKAGITTGVVTLVRNLKEKEASDHERRT